jgi:ATP-dependent DNA helicase RecG
VAKETETKTAKAIHPLLADLSPKRRKALREAGLDRPERFVEMIPRRFLDRTTLQKIAQAVDGEEILCEVRIRNIRLAYGKRERLVAQAYDDTGTMDLTWFIHARFILQHLREGMRVLLWGKVGWFRGPQIVHPSYEELAEGQEAKGSIQPVYPLTEGLREANVDQRMLQKLALGAFTYHTPPEILPEFLRPEKSLSRLEKLRLIHEPKSLMQSQVFLMQEQAMEWFPTLVRLRKRRADLAGTGRVFRRSPELEERARQAFGFALHEGQRDAVERLASLLESGDRVHSLLQGDVGSGKTAICLLASLGVLAAGSQVAVLAPTEVLAKQHLTTFRRVLAEMSIPVLYLAGGQPRAERQTVLNRLAHGGPCVAVGTHALLSDDVVFRDLGLAVIDEQHRFGVGQRQALTAKGNRPHLVVASATPIPRSLQLASYGDMEVVEVRTKPEGRLVVNSRVVPPVKRDGMDGWLREELAKGQKLFWVVPRVEDSEEGVASIEAAEERLHQAYPGVPIAVLHGRMDGPQQLDAIDRFRRSETRILICTTVVEVGVDVPDANLMVIEHAENFGLAQLHQLRGRVGRGGGQGWCFLVPDSAEKLERLRAFATCQDGFDIAELDLEERGAGNLEGQDQSGGRMGRSGLLKEHMGLLLSWRDGVDEILAGRQDLSNSERTRWDGWLGEEALGQALTG